MSSAVTLVCTKGIRFSSEWFAKLSGGPRYSILGIHTDGSVFLGICDVYTIDIAFLHAINYSI